MSTIQEYQAVKHPDSIVDYGRRWGDSTRIKRTVLTTKITSPDGTITETDTIDEEEVVVIKGFLLPNEVIIESEWTIKADREKKPTLTFQKKHTGIGQHGKVTSVFLEGGTAGINYKLTNKITTFDTTNDMYRYVSKMGVVRCCRS